MANPAGSYQMVLAVVHHRRMGLEASNDGRIKRDRSLALMLMHFAAGKGLAKVADEVNCSKAQNQQY